MAKQAGDTSTKELEIPFIWDRKTTFEELIKKLQFKVDELYRLRCYAENDMQALIQQGINYAGTTWKDGKYLYLVYPADQSGKRVRQYVGSDEKECQAALDKLDRGQKVLKFEREIANLNGKLSGINYYIEMCFRQ